MNYSEFFFSFQMTYVSLHVDDKWLSSRSISQSLALGEHHIRSCDPYILGYCNVKKGLTKGNSTNHYYVFKCHRKSTQKMYEIQITRELFNNITKHHFQKNYGLFGVIYTTHVGLFM